MSNNKQAKTLSGQTIKTTCPYCGVGCGVQVTVNNDSPVSISGDQEHPANFGKLCTKGSNLGDTLGHPNRLLYPSIAGQRVGWDEATDTIAKRMDGAIKEFGRESIALYVSGQLLTEDYYVANKFVKGYLGTANIDTNSRLCMASSVAGHKRAFGSDTVPGCYADLDEADLVVITGANMAWCHPILFNRILKAREKNPQMRVVVIDPRATMTAKMADIHLALNSDSDRYLFNGLLSWLAATKNCDTEYIERHTSGFETAVKQASSITPAVVAEHTGIAVEEIEQFYHVFAKTEKTVTLYSQGVNQSEYGTDTVNSIINCHLATGRIGKAGTGPLSLTGQPNAMGGREVGGLANMLACHMELTNPEHRHLVWEFWKSPYIASQPGLKAVDLFAAARDEKIKVLWIMATNPADSMPQGHDIEEALRKIPTVIVSDITPHSDTAQLADILLPAEAWGEKNGTVTNSERRISRQRKLQDAPGEARADWWALAEVAKKLFGHIALHRSAFSYTGPAAIFREYAQLSGFKNNGSRDFTIAGLATLTEQEYDQLTPIQWPVSATTTKAENVFPIERAQLAEQPVRFFANGGFFTKDARARFISCSSSVRQRVNSRYSYVLNTGRIRDQWHTMTRTGYSIQLSLHLSEPYVEIHPEDAKRISIKPAEIVSLRTQLGNVQARAWITNTQLPGNLFMPMHWSRQFASNARVDTLIAPVTDPHSGQPALKSQPVAIGPWLPASYGFMVLQKGTTELQRLLSERMPEDYWAVAPCKGGCRLECASHSDAEQLHEKMLSLVYHAASGDGRSPRPGNFDEPVRPVLNQADNQHTASYHDPFNQSLRSALFNKNQLTGAIFIAHKPVTVARQFVANLLGEKFDSVEERNLVLAGNPKNGATDPGTTICICQSVGKNQINDAIVAGNNTLEALGTSTGAGITCGSCRGELHSMLATADAGLTRKGISQVAASGWLAKAKPMVRP